MKKKPNETQISLVTIGLTLIALKLTSQLSWDWIWITAPFWLWLLLFFLLILGRALGYLAELLINQK